MQPRLTASLPKKHTGEDQADKLLLDTFTETSRERNPQRFLETLAQRNHGAGLEQCPAQSKAPSRLPASHFQNNFETNFSANGATCYSSYLPSFNILPSNQNTVNHISPLASPNMTMVATGTAGGSIGDNTGVGTGPGPLRHPRPLTAADLHLQLEKEQEAVVSITNLFDIPHS